MKARKDIVEALIRFLRGELSKDESREVQEKIRTDQKTAEYFAILRNFAGWEKKLNWKEIEDAALKLSSRQFRDYQKRRGKNKLPYAVTIYDSGLLPLPMGVRSSPVDTRRIKYRIDDLELEMSFYPASFESYDILGRVLGLEGGEIKVLLKSGKDTYVSVPDEFNVFRFERIPSADYSLQIIKRKDIIGIADFQL